MKTFAMFGVIVMVLGAFAGLAQGMGPMDGINPKADSDKDGLVNAQEYLWGTDPNDPDSDADGCYDGWEAWYDAHKATDINGVAFMDAKYHFDPNSADAGKVADTHNLVQVRDGDANALVNDPDNDGWNNLHEFLVGSDPTNPNTDGDIYVEDSADPDPLISNGAGEPGGGNGGNGSGIGEALAFV